MAKLDKFYTKSEVAKACLDFLYLTLKIEDAPHWIEPSAGNGAFSNLRECEAYDIEPEDKNIIKQDFFTYKPQYTDYICFGNPPFGNRSKLAIDFFNYAATFSDVIAFIVPVSFQKWSIQKQLSKNFKLVAYKYLEPTSFLDREKDFSVRTVFQIWTKKNLFQEKKDLRLKKAPPISHPDFKIWQYNATVQALPCIDEDWEIATYRQGYHDYNKKFTIEQREYIRDCMTGKETGRKQQFFFIKPLTEQSKKVINSMDFNLLAERNISTPGFGKGDFVNYYIEIKNKISQKL